MKNIICHMLTLGANINKLYAEKLTLPFFLFIIGIHVLERPLIIMRIACDSPTLPVT